MCNKTEKVSFVRLTFILIFIPSFFYLFLWEKNPTAKISLLNFVLIERGRLKRGGRVTNATATKLYVEDSKREIESRLRCAANWERFFVLIFDRKEVATEKGECVRP